ncbi:cupin domain-containing protein [Dyadobacter psychrotolerans]|uniref:Cupin domain-containing protein n=1 Tax=Dyadobacter psychrotolerans TaxID=2541721 RepID=A0A4R5DN73_9BACT|nr:cupin domain-containing protein [Dyadobacter psychrotolerans]TDE15639.1 cupin domain-containing protein [Dyadobacter psychrotolerans]
MKKETNLFITQLLAVFILTVISASAQEKTNSSPDTQSIFPKGSKAPAVNFTGTAWVHSLIESDSTFNIPVASVTFEPGARTKWHTHGGGQALIAIDGIGYYQEKGKPIRILRKGDSVKCAADTPHWHGASPETGFVQIAVTPNATKGRVTWLQPVSDEEYKNLKK